MVEEGGRALVVPAVGSDSLLCSPSLTSPLSPLTLACSL